MNLSARLEALEHARALRRGEFLDGPAHPQYRNDPAGYCRDVLRVSLTPDQEAVLAAVPVYKRVLTPAANEVGKTFLAACLASWHYDTHDPGITLTTAPTAQSVSDLLWRELRTLRRGDVGFLPKACRLQSSDNHFCAGYTARDAHSFHGRHTASVCVIFDEAEGIAREFWDAAESMADLWVCFYNPTTTTAQTVVEERSGRWKQLNISALSHPNITAALRNEPPPIPTAVTLEKVLRRLERWSTEIHDPHDAQPNDVILAGRRFRPGPVAEARVLGRRPSQAVDSVFSEATWRVISDTRHDVKPHYPVVIGCDVARFGDDATVFHVRKGPCSIHHESRFGWDTVATAMRCQQLADSLGAGRHTPIHVDDCGVGGGVVDQLAHKRYAVIPVNGAAKPMDHAEYPNVRSECWFVGAEAATGGMMDLSRLDAATRDALRAQLLAPSYLLDTKGRRVVEKKADVKARLSRSPDDADALLLAYYLPPPVSESHE